MMNSITPKSLAFLLAVLATNLPAADLLVAMSGGGTVERYDSITGKHGGTFIPRVERPNALAFGPDGALYVATGAVGGPGAVKKFHGDGDLRGRSGCPSPHSLVERRIQHPAA